MKNIQLLIIFIFAFAFLCVLPFENKAYSQQTQTEEISGEDDFLEDPFASEEKTTEIADPLEPMNRFFFNFNDFFYTKLFIPVAKGYRKIMPKPIRKHLKNFFQNLIEPRYIINSALQGRAKESILETKRFILNTTLGLAGIFDVAAYHWDLKPNQQDTGKTLARYGANEGIYLVLPFLGPSNLRDTFGLIGDAYMHPTTFTLNTKQYIIFGSVAYTNESSFAPDKYKNLKKDFIDPYTGFKNAYIQHRREEIKENKK